MLIAVVLVGLRSLWKEQAAPAAPPRPIAGPPLAAGATPRYYVKVGGARGVAGLAIIVGDEQTGRTIATYPLGKGNSLTSSGVSGARATTAGRSTSCPPSPVGPGSGRAGPLVLLSPSWYLVRILPGSAHPVRVTRLTVDYPAGRGAPI